jgi:hypothetical protein
MFTRQLLRFDLTHQGRILDQIAEPEQAGRLRSTLSRELPWSLEACGRGNGHWNRGARWGRLCGRRPSPHCQQSRPEAIRSEERPGYRNGYRPHTLSTQVGDLALQITVDRRSSACDNGAPATSCRCCQATSAFGSLATLARSL